MDKEKVKEQVEKQIECITEEGVQTGNVDYLYRLIDIHKDLENETYWKEKLEMRGYGNYGNYGEGNYGRRGVKGTGRSRYSARGGRGGSYRGEGLMDDMQEMFMNYSEGKERYGHEEESLEYMLQAITEFIETLEQDAGSEEEAELVKKYARKISNI